MAAERTRGGDMLERCPDSHAEIAVKMGVHKSLVTRWISGHREPSDAACEILEDLYGIPRAAWQEPVTSKPSPKLSTPSPPTLPDADEYAAEDNNDRLRRYIREGMRELELDTDLSGVKRAEALKKLVDAQVALDRSTGENALTMTRIVAHPDFQRVVRTITEAIAPFPDALRAATKALESVRG